MPTTYAHWRFGDRCIGTLPEKLQKVIEKNRSIFDYGVHGPDIFFYYNCLKKNEVNAYGSRMHEIPFGDTLGEIKPHFENCDRRSAALAYLLGFLCHFTLDSYCHGYIDRKDELSNATHGKIESQYDRHLLIKDGYDPVKKSVTFSLKPDKKMAHVIAEIFPAWDEKTIYKTLKDQRMYLNLLKDDSDIKRLIMSKGMDLLHVSSFKDLMLTKENDPEVADAMLRLDKLGEDALEHYPLLAKSLIGYLMKDRPLDPYFRNHFCPKEDYKDIPILPLEEERFYVTAGRQK